MNPFITQIIIQTTLRSKLKGKRRKQYSPQEIIQGYRELRLLTRRTFKDLLLIGLGIFSAAFGLKSFLLPNEFIDGGVTGISLLMSEVTRLPLSLLILFINLPFILLGWKVISRQFAIKTALAITALAIVLATVPFPEITRDKLLVAAFGGFFLGAGIALAIRGGAVLDGTEVLAIFLSRKFHTSIGDIIIGLNVVIFAVAAYLLSIEQALYSMITYLAASRTINFIVEGLEEYTGITVISPMHSQIQEMVTLKLGKGVTVYKGRGGFGSHGRTHDVDILYIVVTRLEKGKLNTEISRIDPNAFIITSSVKDIQGGMVKKRALKH